MSQVRNMGLVMCALLILFAAGCGDPNSEAIFDPNTGKHIGNWMVIHGNSYGAYDGRCNECHGMRLDGGISAIGCFTNAACHSSVTSCGTCHGNPPSGRSFPNAAGAHAVHLSIQNTNFNCDTCHAGAGDGTILHMNYIVEASFSNATYNSAGGIAAYSSITKSCSEISCHGGQTSPNWVTGSIDVNGQCSACHIYGVSEHNSYNSGEHQRHVVDEGISCTDCHDTAKLASVHFDDLNSTLMTEADLTIINATGYTDTNNTCTIQCHGENHVNDIW